MNKPLIILGAGGHAAVLVDILLNQKRKIIGLACPGKIIKRKIFNNISRLLKDEDVLNYPQDEVLLVNGIDSLPGNNFRQEVFSHFKASGFYFETVVSSTAIVSAYAILREGCQILHKAVIQTDTVIEANTIINTGVIVDHDCQIGKDNHLAPGVVVSGHVRTGNAVHIGTGASVIQSIQIGANTVIGAGASITKNVSQGKTVFPAKVFTR